MSQLSLKNLEKFEEYCHNQNMAKGTIRNYLYELKKISEVDPRKYLAENKKKRMLIFAFRRYLKYLKSIGKINAEELFDLLDTFKPPKGKKKTTKGKWYSKDKWDGIIDSAPNRCARLGIYMIFQFGFRLGEIINLRIQDIDFETHFIHVQTRSDWHPKYEKDRSIPMHPKQERILARWIQARSQLDHDYIIFSGRKKNQVSSRTFEYWCAKTYPGLKPHDIRRSFAKVLYYNSGPDIYLVKELLGHESVATTTRYLGLEAKELREKYTKAMA